MKPKSDDLRAWQRRAFDAWKDASRRGIAEVVTGGGKTRFAMHCMREYRSTVPAATVVIVVPTNALLDQWFEETISYFGVPYSDVVLLKGRRRIVESRIHIGVINSVAKMAPSYHGCPVFLIVDECHRAASPIFQSVLAFPSNASLGLSATPDRPYDDGLDSILIPRLGPIIIRYTYREALADGVIVPFGLQNVVFEMEPDEEEQYTRLTAAIAQAIKRHGIESQQVVRLMIRRTRLSNLCLGRVRIALTLVARNRGKKVLLFHEDIEACNVIAATLTKYKVSANAYHSKMTLAQRVEVLRAFREGALEVLVTCRALDEGFNVPEAEIGIIAASTATYRQRIQRLGRVLRPAPGKERAEIYSIISTQAEVRRLAEEANDLEDIACVTWTRM